MKRGTLQSLTLLCHKQQKSIYFILKIVIIYCNLHVNYVQGRKLEDFITFCKWHGESFYTKCNKSTFLKVISTGAKPKLCAAYKLTCSSKQHIQFQWENKTPQRQIQVKNEVLQFWHLKFSKFYKNSSFIHSVNLKQQFYLSPVPLSFWKHKLWYIKYTT